MEQMLQTLKPEKSQPIYRLISPLSSLKKRSGANGASFLA
jgi:hypothetical protein